MVGKRSRGLSEEVAAWRGRATRDEAPSQCVYASVRQWVFDVPDPWAH